MDENYITTEAELEVIRKIDEARENHYKEMEKADNVLGLTTQHVLQRYCEANAKYGEGDILMHTHFKEYMKVDRLEATIQMRNRIIITYYGKGYKKVRGRMVKTPDENTRRIPEQHAELYDAVIDKP